MPSFGNAFVRRNESMNPFRPGNLNRAMEYAAGMQKIIEISVVAIAMIKDCAIEETRLFCWKTYDHHFVPQDCANTCGYSYVLENASSVMFSSGP